MLQFKLEDSSSLSPATASSAASATTTTAPTSPSNGVTQDPLKTTNVSSVQRRQNSSENVPNSESKESPVTPNRSDDDKGRRRKFINAKFTYFSFLYRKW